MFISPNVLPHTVLSTRIVTFFVGFMYVCYVFLVSLFEVTASLSDIG